MGKKLTDQDFFNRLIVTPGGHWRWMGPTIGLYGGWGSGYAHRKSYALHFGPIPEGLVVDHVCRYKLCVNPSHLQAITQRDNVMRARVNKTGCRNGHPWTEGSYNNEPRKGGLPRKRCLICRRATERKRRR